jgi:flavin-dependent dehydrogenase
VLAIDGAVGDWHLQVRSADTDAALTLRAPVAIAAHGSWEALPAARPRRRASRSASDLLAFKANFRKASLPEGVLPVLSFDGGYGGMVLANDGVTTVACCIRRDALEAARRAAPGARAGEAVEALLRRECSGVRDALQAAVRDGPWLAAGPIDPGMRLRADDTLLRIGNAAGEAHPIIGEGISMALQSAWLLCSRLLNAQGWVDATGVAWQREVAHRYAQDWQREFEPRLQLAAAFAHLAMRPGAAAPLLALARVFPGLLTLGARWGGKVHCAAGPATIARLAPRPAASTAVLNMNAAGRAASHPQ